MQQPEMRTAFVKPRQSLDVNRLVPIVFTMVSLLLFMVPIWLILDIFLTAAVAQFSSRLYWICLIIPPAILGVHLIQTKTSVPQKKLMVAMLLAPSLILLIIAEMNRSNAISQRIQLRSADCSANVEKSRLQISWLAAYKLYDECITETAAQSGGNYSKEELMSTFRIQDCSEYTRVMGGGQLSTPKIVDRTELVADWAFLQGLEDTLFCSGWCYEGVQLWSTNVHKDACSIAVASIFENRVRPHMKQISALMLITIIALLAHSVVNLVPQLPWPQFWAKQ